MKKLIALIVLGLIGFYVAWPAWSAYRIATALQSADESVLASKIDFTAVRVGLRPTVEREVETRIDQELKSAGALGAALGGDVKKQLASRVADGVLAQIVTPANVIRIAREGGNVAGTVEKIVMEQMGKVGGIPGLGGGRGIGGGIGGGTGGGLPGGIGGVLGGIGGAATQLGIPGIGGGSTPAAPPAAPQPAAQPPAKAADSKPSYGLSNIKNFGFAGPLGLTLSLARDPAATKPDVTTVMRFKDFDWKITEVVPNL